MPLGFNKKSRENASPEPPDRDGVTPESNASETRPEYAELKKSLVSRQLRIVSEAQERLAPVPVDRPRAQRITEIMAATGERRERLRSHVRWYVDTKSRIPKNEHWKFRDIFFKEYCGTLAEIIAGVTKVRAIYEQHLDAHPAKGAKAGIYADQLQKINQAIELLQNREVEARRRLNRAQKKRGRMEREQSGVLDREETSADTAFRQQITDLLESAPRMDEIGAMPQFEPSVEPSPAVSEAGKKVTIWAPSLDALQYETPETIRQFIIGNIMKIANQDASYEETRATSSSLLEDTADKGFISIDSKTGSVTNIITGEELSDETIESIIAHLHDLSETINRYYRNVAEKEHKAFAEHTIETFFGNDFFDNLKKVHGRLEGALQKKDGIAARELLARSAPNELRSYFLARYGIPHSEEDSTKQSRYEACITAWLKRGEKGTRHMGDAFSTFLIHCDRALEELKGFPDEHFVEKRRIVERSRTCLHYTPQIRFPDAETHEQFARALRELYDLYNRDLRAEPREDTSVEDVIRRRLDDIRRDTYIFSQLPRGASVDEKTQISYIERGTFSEHKDNQLYGIDHNLIVGCALNRPGWITGDETTIRNQAIIVRRNPTEENLKNLFFEKTGAERIELQRLHGPAGDIFLVKKGMEAVVAAKAAGVSRIIARIYEVRIGSEQSPFACTLKSSVSDLQRFLLLREFHRIGFITAPGIDSVPVNVGKDEQIPLSITAHVLPWFLWFSESIPKICARYEELYGVDLLKKADIPEEYRDVLFNELQFQKRFLGAGKGRASG